MTVASSFLDAALEKPFATILTTLLLAGLTSRIYNLFFHPCAKFPGPWLRGAFQWPFHYIELKGNGPGSLHELHKKYGPVVRVAPDMLSFNRAAAYKDIYGFQADRTQIPKDYKRAPPGAEDFLPLVLSNDADHTRLRRVVAHAFSETALREQEPIIQSHIARFNHEIGKVAEDGDEERDVNMWIDWLSFDILSDLTYGESFGSIKNRQTNQFILDQFNGSQFFPAIVLTWDYFVANWLIRGLLALESFRKATDGAEAVTEDKVQKRFDRGADARRDFMTYIIRNNTNDSKTAVSMAEIRGTTVVFMAAGGEEPASVMSATLYYLMQHASALGRVQDELRSVYTAKEEITFASVEKLAYLNAVIRETMRIRPSNAGHNSRRTTKTETIDGHVVPPDTSVEVSAYATTHCEANFAEPDTFAPERWLSDPPSKFANDDKEALQPFLVGPRACLGKSLAMIMIRSTLASFLWQFDIEMVDPKQNWLDQKYRVIWHRPGLKVRLTRRRG